MLLRIAILLCVSLSSGHDYYKMLGITKDADVKQIRKAFKKLAVIKHPDKNQDDPKAHDYFLLLTRAYEVLKDADLRRHYDMLGEVATPAPSYRPRYQSYTYYRDHFGIYDDDPHVITLSKSDFEWSVEDSPQSWFINFYSPRCSHCHELAPTWRALASVLRGVVMFGAVNCQEEWQLCRQQQISSYPSLVFYVSVRHTQRERYMGERSHDALYQFVLGHVTTSVATVSTQEAWLLLSSSPGAKLLLLCDHSPLSYCPIDDERIVLAALLDGLAGVAALDCVALSDTCHNLSIANTGSAYWLTAGTTSPITATEPHPIASEVLMPELRQLDASAFDLIVSDLRRGVGKSWLIYFYIGAAEEQDLQMKRLPVMVPNMHIGRVNCGREAVLCTRLSVSRYPIVAVFKAGGGHEYHHGLITAHSIATFAREAAVATNLHTLSPADFPVLDNGQEGAWFIDFYVPWCPPCLRLLPELRKASRSFPPATVRFATVDCTIHEQLCHQHSVRAYPTTKLYNATAPGVEPRGRVFSGEHTAARITDFIRDLLNPPVLLLNESTFYATVGQKSPDSIWVVSFMMPWCGPCQQLAPQYSKFAKLVSGVSGLVVAEVNCEAEASLCHQQGVRSYPSIRLYPLQSRGLNTVAMFTSMNRDAASLRHWLHNFLPSPIVEMSAATFSDAAFSSTTSSPWLVDFYAPWCGHCTAFEPEFITVAHKLAGRVKCGKLNCETHRAACMRASISAYPTVRFYAVRWDQGVEIASQSAEVILRFVEQQLAASRPQASAAGHDEL